MQFVVWFVPDLITNAVAVSAMGVAIGPIYVITMNIAAEVLPKW